MRTTDLAQRQKQPKKDAKVLVGLPKGLPPAGSEFDKVVALIDAARTRAMAAVNRHELMGINW